MQHCSAGSEVAQTTLQIASLNVCCDKTPNRCLFSLRKYFVPVGGDLFKVTALPILQGVFFSSVPLSSSPFYSCTHIFLVIFLLTVSIISTRKCEINVYIIRTS